MTLAQQVSLYFDKAPIADVCVEYGAVELPQVKMSSVARRFQFHDGSVILDCGIFWDYGYSNCTCCQAFGHDVDCLEGTSV